MMLASARHLGRLDRDLRAGHWNQSLPGLQLRGKTLGLVGFGGIGARFAAPRPRHRYDGARVDT